MNKQSYNNKENNLEPQNKVPKEVLDQYPYGEFPIRYTKSGQEDIRRNSEKRFSYDTQQQTTHEDLNKPNNNDLNITSLLPLIQLMSNKKQPADTMKILSEILFKDNKDFQQIFNLISKQKPQEFDKSDSFPNTNKVNISSLKRIDQ